MRKRIPSIALTAACFLVGVALLLVAVDVARVRDALASDDVRYQAQPEETRWTSTRIVPGDAARRLLGVRDDVLFRRALRGVRLSRPDMPGFSDPSFVVNRNEATAWLTDIVQGDGDPQRKSAAANLLGILSFADAIADYTNREKLLVSAAGRFRQAISFDPGNDVAKYNLELALSRSRGLELTEAGGGTAPSPGGKGARGAGAGDPGSGY